MIINVEWCWSWLFNVFHPSKLFNFPIFPFVGGWILNFHSQTLGGGAIRWRLLCWLCQQQDQSQRHCERFECDILCTRSYSWPISKFQRYFWLNKDQILQMHLNLQTFCPLPGQNGRIYEQEWQLGHDWCLHSNAIGLELVARSCGSYRLSHHGYFVTLW